MDEPQVGALARVLRELSLPPTMLSALLSHAVAVRDNADRLGLISARDRDHVVSRHTADSLLFALARAPSEGEHWSDVGSGAGFPGMVLACCYPGAHFTLVEPQQRRAGFLELQRARLGLGNVEVVGARSETLADGAFDVVVARALADPELSMTPLRRLVVRNGAVIVAAGSDATPPPGADDIDVARPGVDSPGRLFMIAESVGGA